MIIETSPIADAVPRAAARFSGRVTAVKVESRDSAPRFSMQLDDGTGRIDAIFIGRRVVPGIEPGAQVSIEGTVCAADALPRVFNPRYELLKPA